jgi:HPt (histidine-containing phosphotransfer) domain-containing protein
MVDQELNELRREFLSEARGKVEEMLSGVGRQAAPEASERLIYLAHQLKGSGGSYGFQGISEQAAEIEKAIEATRDGGNESPDSIRNRITDLLAEIDRCARNLG